MALVTGGLPSVGEGEWYRRAGQSHLHLHCCLQLAFLLRSRECAARMLKFSISFVTMSAQPCLAFTAVCDASVARVISVVTQCTDRHSDNSAPLRVASSSNGVSTAAAGKCTYRTTLPRMKTFFTELWNGVRSAFLSSRVLLYPACPQS